uniref:Uncharacterized protein n=1 Tax=Ceratitis capitata TaxID=7213 RepID=W8B4U9_CERCA
MPSTAKKQRNKSRSSLKRNDGRNRKKEKEVRELWFNPQATKMGESHGTMQDCDCKCQVLRSEKVQQELRKLSKIYSQTDVTAAKADEGKASRGGFSCFKKSNSAKRARSKQRAEKENTPKRKSKERDASRKEHEKQHRVRSTSALRRFKTREEAKRYRELKTIYTTKPRNEVKETPPKEKETATNCFKRKKDKPKDGGTKAQLDNTSEESVYSVEQAKVHESRKCEPRSAAAKSKPMRASSRQRAQSRSRADKSNKKQAKKSEVGCCGMRKKSHVDKEEEEFEAYKLAQSMPARTKRQTASPTECPLTPEEIELLEKLKETYSTEPKAKGVRKPPPPPPAEEETGCCGAKSKKKQRRPTDEAYAPRKTKSADLNVRRKKKPKTGRSKSDSSFYGRKFFKLTKPRVSFCIPCTGRRTKHGKRIKQIYKKRKKDKGKAEETKTTVVYEQTQPSKVRVQDAHGIRKAKPKEKTQPKPSKTKVQEKLQKQLDVSEKKIEKPLKSPAQTPKKPLKIDIQEKVEKKVSDKAFTKKTKEKQASDNVFTKKTKEKKVVAQKQTQMRLEVAAEEEEKASYMSCCSLSAKHKVKKEKPKKILATETRKKHKDTEKLSKKPSKSSCCSEVKESLQRKLAAWQQRPATAESKVEVQKKTSTTSCCSNFKTGLTQKLDNCQNRFLKMLSYAKNDRTKQRQVKKPKEAKQQPTQANCCANIKADLQKKLESWKTQTTRHKAQPKVKKKSSETACCMSLKKEMHEKLDAWQKQKAAKVGSKEKLAKKPSVTSCFSCYSAEKSKGVNKSRRKIVKPSKNVEKTPNPLETLCALGKHVRPKAKIMPEKPTTPTKQASPTRKEATKQTSPTRKELKQMKTKNEIPERSSQTSFHTCWDWFDDTAERVRAPVGPKETKENAPPKSKTSATSFLTCCSGLCLPKKFREQPYRKSKRKTATETGKREEKEVEEEIIDKPANMSYCTALYQEFENLIMQQQLCPILLSETSVAKRTKGSSMKYDFNYCQQHFSKPSLGNTGKSSTQTKAKKHQVPETAQKESKAAENNKLKSKIKDKDKNNDVDNENQKKIQQALGASYNKRTLLQRKHRQQQTPQASSEKSTSNSEMQPTVYVPEYVLGKPPQLGMSLAHVRHIPYNLVINSYGRKKCERNFSKNYIYGIGCQN